MKYFGCTARTGTAILLAATLSGCAAVNTAVTHHDLETSTRLSHTIFLNPVSSHEQTVLVRVGNTSGVSGVNFRSSLVRDLRNNGYRVVTRLSKAHYLIQANILKAGKSTPNNTTRILGDGFGGAISGGLIGTGAGALIGDSGGATLAGGIAGAAIGYAADMLVKNENYALVTDVRISERLAKGASVQETSRLQQGNSASQVIRQSGRTHWMRWRTRVVSTAQQMNLTFRRAKRALISGTAHAVAGLFIH